MAGSSASILNPQYWWYQARASLLGVVLQPFLPDDVTVLDIGSADGPSVAWVDASARRIPLDLDPSGLRAGGVCASALRLPLRTASVDAVSAFDVIEHFPDDAAVVEEIRRVLKPGGRLLVSVPAYQWAWSSHDVRAGHHRRYTRRRIAGVLERAGFRIERSTYVFAATLPLFAADRLAARIRRRPAASAADSSLPRWAEVLLLRLSGIDAWLLRRMDLPFGSSAVLAAARRA